MASQPKVTLLIEAKLDKFDELARQGDRLKQALGIESIVSQYEALDTHLGSILDKIKAINNTGGLQGGKGGVATGSTGSPAAAAEVKSAVSQQISGTKALSGPAQGLPREHMRGPSGAPLGPYPQGPQTIPPGMVAVKGGFVPGRLLAGEAAPPAAFETGTRAYTRGAVPYEHLPVPELDAEEASPIPSRRKRRSVGRSGGGLFQEDGPPTPMGFAAAGRIGAAMRQAKRRNERSEDKAERAREVAGAKAEAAARRGARQVAGIKIDESGFYEPMHELPTLSEYQARTQRQRFARAARGIPIDVSDFDKDPPSFDGGYGILGGGGAIRGVTNQVGREYAQAAAQRRATGAARRLAAGRLVGGGVLAAAGGIAAVGTGILGGAGGAGRLMGGLGGMGGGLLGAGIGFGLGGGPMSAIVGASLGSVVGSAFGSIGGTIAQYGEPALALENQAAQLAALGLFGRRGSGGDTKATLGMESGVRGIGLNQFGAMRHGLGYNIGEQTKMSTQMFKSAMAAPTRFKANRQRTMMQLNRLGVHAGTTGQMLFGMSRDREHNLGVIDPEYYAGSGMEGMTTSLDNFARRMVTPGMTRGEQTAFYDLAGSMMGPEFMQTGISGGATMENIRRFVNPLAAGGGGFRGMQFAEGAVRGGRNMALTGPQSPIDLALMSALTGGKGVDPNELIGAYEALEKGEILNPNSEYNERFKSFLQQAQKTGTQGFGRMLATSALRRFMPKLGYSGQQKITDMILKGTPADAVMAEYAKIGGGETLDTLTTGLATPGMQEAAKLKDEMLVIGTEMIDAMQTFEMAAKEMAKALKGSATTVSGVGAAIMSTYGME
jgi:hypothetical protein